MRFELYDTVRLVRLLTPQRDITGTEAALAQPAVGDQGTIVDVPGDRYLVEDVTPDGGTRWLAEFEAAELDLVARPSSTG